MAANETWTVGRLLQWTTDYLKSRGADTPRLDAEVLLAEALGCKRIELYTAFEEVPKDEQRTAFREFVRRRAEGSPVAYLVGRREFYSLNFKVGPGVLVPRPETELLVVAVLDSAKARQKDGQPEAGPLAIADVGTGSGILAVCAAKYLRTARITAIDTSRAALAIAAENAAAHNVADRIDFLDSDLFAAVPPEQKFDFVLSNPPYVSTAEATKLPRDVKDFEPPEALVAGPRGTEVIERLIPQAAERLTVGGHLLIEISPMIHDSVQKLLAAESRLEPGPTIKDLARLPRVVQAKRRA
jgi:release factor glutamine methyltransferase